MPTPPKGSGGRPNEDRPIDDLIRAALRGGELVVPSTPAEAAAFREQVACEAAPVPPELLDPHWLFECGDRDAVPATSKTLPEEHPALAARDGKSITAAVLERMAADRARSTGCCDPRSSLEHDSQVATEFATASRLREIAELAEWVASERCPTGVVDPELIAAAERLGVSFNDYDDAFDGLLEHRSGAFHVYCNLRRVAAPRSDRARFTLAHELGHYFIDAHRRKLERGESLPLSQCDFESAQPIEREADHFAAHLLMPSRRFVREVRGTPRGLAAVLMLRRRFDTSLTSTACRYAELSGVSCAVVKWSAGGHVWRVLSPQAREAQWGRVIGTVEKVPAGSATARALAGEVVPAAGFFQTGSTVTDWFERVPRGSGRNSVLIEQAIPLGQFGVLTVLVPADGEFGSAV